jgi:N-acetylmuramoyl-L-alanine amidase
MTTLADGTVVNESIDAVHVTRAADVPGIFQYGPRVVSSITIHHWGALGQNISDVVAYLASDNPRMSSAHAVIQGGTAYALVNPDDAAWHAGTRQGNTTSIGLELHPEGTDADYKTAAAYIQMLRGVYGDVPLVPHNHWISTDCPGAWDLARLDTMARAINAPVPTPAPQPPAPVVSSPTPAQPVHSDFELHWVVERGDSLFSIATYYGIPSDVNRIAAYNGIDPNGILSIGQKVFIPGPLVWNIEAPDTIRSVAAYYGLDPAYLAQLNGLDGPDATIYIGNTLTIKA